MSAKTLDNMLGGASAEDAVRESARTAQRLAFLCELGPDRLRGVPTHELVAAHLCLTDASARLLSAIQAMGAIGAAMEGGAA